MNSAHILKIGDHRGNPRLWLQGAAPLRSGFVPGSRYAVEACPGGLIVRLIDGEQCLDAASQAPTEGRQHRRVSRKVYASGAEVPVLDVNSHEELSNLSGARVVRAIFGDGEVIITPLASEVRRLRRMRRLSNRIATGAEIETAGVAAGGGVLTAAVHDGLHEAGLSPHVAFFNEIREDLSEHALARNRALSADTVLLNLPLQEMAYDDEVLRRVGEVDVLELGLPCSGASLAGRARRKTRHPEDHPDVGHLVASGINMVVKFNPVAAIFENVPQYATSASASILRNQLRDLGYDVHEREIMATDFGDLESRRRWVLVAMTRGIPFDINNLKAPASAHGHLCDVLVPPDHPGAEWSEMRGLKDKEARDLAAGNHFRMQIFDYGDQHIGVLTKGMSRNRSTDPKIRHPDNPELLRVPTPLEHARFKGVDDGLVTGLPKKTAHELLGQSVCTGGFKALARAIGEALVAWQAAGARDQHSDDVRACEGANFTRIAA